MKRLIAIFLAAAALCAAQTVNGIPNQNLGGVVTPGGNNTLTGANTIQGPLKAASTAGANYCVVLLPDPQYTVEAVTRLANTNWATFTSTVAGWSGTGCPGPTGTAGAGGALGAIISVGDWVNNGGNTSGDSANCTGISACQFNVAFHGTYAGTGTGGGAWQLANTGVPLISGIGNHDYHNDSGAMATNPRIATEFDAFFTNNTGGIYATGAPGAGFGFSSFATAPENYTLGSGGQIQLGGKYVMMMGLEIYTRDASISANNNAIGWADTQFTNWEASAFCAAPNQCEAWVTTHDHLNNDGSLRLKTDPQSTVFYAMPADAHVSATDPSQVPAGCAFGATIANTCGLQDVLFRRHSSLRWIFSGHNLNCPPCVQLVDDVGVSGNAFHQIFSDYQQLVGLGGESNPLTMAILLEFNPTANTVTIVPWNPVTNTIESNNSPTPFTRDASAGVQDQHALTASGGGTFKRLAAGYGGAVDFSNASSSQPFRATSTLFLNSSAATAFCTQDMANRGWVMVAGASNGVAPTLWNCGPTQGNGTTSPYGVPVVSNPNFQANKVLSGANVIGGGASGNTIVTPTDGKFQWVFYNSPLSLVKTANYTLSTGANTSADVGSIFYNTGAAGSVTFSLYACNAGAVRNTESFFVDAAQNLVVAANGTDTIQLGASTSAGGGNITSSTVGSSAMLHCANTGHWKAISYTGTWAVN